MSQMKTIEVAVELLAHMGEWSEPVRVRYTEDPFPMLEFQTVRGGDESVPVVRTSVMARTYAITDDPTEADAYLIPLERGGEMSTEQEDRDV